MSRSSSAFTPMTASRRLLAIIAPHRLVAKLRAGHAVIEQTDAVGFLRLDALHGEGADL